MTALRGRTQCFVRINRASGRFVVSGASSRKLSQLELALAADVSQRHLSWLETGRSLPSRDMVMRLSAAMDIPLRERNTLLQAAGFAAAYNETDLDEPVMTPVLDALNHVLGHHDPFPAIVVDRFWNVKMRNASADRLFNITGDLDERLEKMGATGELNIALLTLHPEGLRQFVVNWDQVLPLFVHRLKRESLASGDPAVQKQCAELIELAGPVEDVGSIADNLFPVLPLKLSIDGMVFSLFSVISTFGTPQDITTDEIRIEAFYPADEGTERFFKATDDTLSR